MDKRALGRHYETMAKEYLCRKGYKYIKMNYYTRFGEIDIIMMDGQTYVFVEVKYRQSDNKGKPFEFVTKSKQNRMMKTAMSYVKQHGLYNHSMRFDIIDILEEEISHYANAFELSRKYMF